MSGHPLVTAVRPAQEACVPRNAPREDDVPERPEEFHQNRPHDLAVHTQEDGQRRARLAAIKVCKVLGFLDGPWLAHGELVADVAGRKALDGSN